jgi:competence protein ComEC
MPLIGWAVASWIVGLLIGATPLAPAPLLLAGAVLAVALLLLDRASTTALAALLLLGAAAIMAARNSAHRDASCRTAATERGDVARMRARTPCAENAGALDQPLTVQRERAARLIERDFGSDAPIVKALLIADTKELPLELRDRFASAGLVHILSISGLHVAIIAEAVALLLGALRAGPRLAPALTVCVIAGYVAMIGAPPPAVRSAVMLGVTVVTRALQRPVSPWAALALGAVAPLVDPRIVTDLGWQLSVAGFAALIAGGRLATRRIPREWRGWRRTLARDLIISVVATIVTAPLVVWAFGRVSLIAPLSNLLAAPVVAVLQPTLFLALVLGGWADAAQLVAAAAHPMIAALDLVARGAAAVPYASLAVAPSLGVAVSAGVGAVALVVAAWSRDPSRALLAAATALVAMAWWPLLPPGSGAFEIHLIDVGQGDAVALRTPHGEWIVMDAGRSWRGGDAGRSTVIPYLRRYGGELSWLILSHPHADHVGGAASVLRALHPPDLLDAGFAGTSEPYRAVLAEASRAGTRWHRAHPGTRLTIDGVELTTLAPDSAWTAGLRDPNLASTMIMVRYGRVRLLLTGDAEGAEEDWLLEQGVPLAADVLKAGHHGSSTSTTPRFLDAVDPRVALVSVGTANSYGHPSASVMGALRARGTTVLRTDQLGSIVLRSDGVRLVVEVAGERWTIPGKGTSTLSEALTYK